MSQNNEKILELKHLIEIQRLPPLNNQKIKNLTKKPVKVKRSQLEFGDITTMGLSFSLATAVGIFAVYMLINGPFAPRSDEGFYMGPTKTDIIANSTDLIPSDPMITGSTSQPGQSELTAAGKKKAFSLEYRLQRIDGQMAYIEAIREGRKSRYIVKPGMKLPSVGRVISVDNTSADAVVLTEKVKITSRGVSPRD